MRTEQELLTDCLVRLERAGVAYMLAGSMASNYWGVPRTTHDLDFVIALQRSEVSNIVAAFRQGFFLQPDSVQNAFFPPHQFNALDEASALKVDFWLLRDDPFEQNAFARRLRVTIFATPAWVSTAEDVILHKLYWHRLTPSDRQLQDAAGVFVVQAGVLDGAYMDSWAMRLGVEEELALLRSGKLRPKST